MRKIYFADSACTDEALMRVADENPVAALLWPWFLLILDDWGRGSANPRQLRARLFPENPAVTVELVSKAIDLFAAADLVLLYVVNGKRYVAIAADKWFRYQTHIRSEKRTKDGSRFPAPPADVARDCVQTRADARDSRECCASPSALPPFCPSPSPSPSLSPSIENAPGSAEPTDPFDDEFWSVWPNHKGSKQLARKRFKSLTDPQRRRCVAAAGYFAEAMDAGLVDPQYQPRAENFVGGTKRYYEEWADGIPSHVHAAAVPRRSGRAVDSAFGALREVARQLDSEVAT